ncbi:MAG: hypothetical protein ACJ74P_08970 [Gaiellaceae bacterium]|jgi:hypothetical protein
MRKVVAFCGVLAALALSAPAFGDPSPPPCQPGQQGNNHPGFKPGSCDNK